MTRRFLISLSTAVAVAAGSIIGAASAAEAPKGAIFASKFEVSGKVDQNICVGKNGEAFALLYEEDTTATVSSGYKMHCIGVMQGAENRIVEQHGYCAEADPEGNQIFWTITPAPHLMGSDAVFAVHEAIAGRGKYAGISAKVTSTCQVWSVGPSGYTLKCEQSQ
jgi:hypothetical protein